MIRRRHRTLRSTPMTVPRSSRRAKPSNSYRERSSESEQEPGDTEEDSDSGSLSIATTKKRKVRGQTRNNWSPKRQRQLSPPFSSDSSPILFEKHGRKVPRRANDGEHGILRNSSVHQTEKAGRNDAGKIPGWATLPYQILVQIFDYASHPLYDERTFQPSPSVNWLAKTSRLCRSFAEPALTILYRSPPLVPMDSAHRLRQLLVADPEPMSYNYRAKVERLQMEISQTAAYTLPGSGLLDIYGIVYNCPRLLDLELYHQKDMSPYRSLDESIKWSYPDSLFYALNENVSGQPTRLRSWRWSSRLAGKTRTIQKLLEIHQSHSFSGIRKLAFVNYQKPVVRKNAEDPQHEKWLANSLTVLRLEHLIIESSTLANSILLPLLPKNLKHLELINCWEILSDDLANFLVSHGSQLRSLTLNHNQSLSLSFLPILGSACPQLETLRMNLTYYNVHSSYRDSQPQYEKLLNINEIPNWPSSLRIVELTQLRNWDVDTAQMFFQSLLSSATSLTNLRRLVIKAILNTNWRDRSSFRDKWVGAFQRVFKRPFLPPKPDISSVGVYGSCRARSGESHSNKADVGNVAVVIYQGVESPFNESLSALEDSCDEDNKGSRAQRIRAPGTRRSTRIIPAKVSTELKEDQIQVLRNSKLSNDRSGTKLTVREMNRARQLEFIHGMCDVVSVTIDNLRPTETQFVEADFLDSEPEGDEDWDGTQDLAGEGGYAW